MLEREIRKARWAIGDAALTTVGGEVMRGLRAEYQERQEALREA